MAARRGPAHPNIAMGNEHRLKIQNSNILNVLIKHVEGKQEMTASQVTAGLGLLRKVMPDLAATADTAADGKLVSVKSMTDNELEAIAAGRSNRDSQETESSQLTH